MSEYTQGVCEDGAAILKDGQQMTIDEILAELRQLTDTQQELSDCAKKLESAHDNLELILASGVCDKEAVQQCYRGLGFDEDYIKGVC